MVDLESSAKMLQAKRKELLDQLAAVDEALAALPSEPAPGIPTRVKPRRLLSDEHRQALIEGGRKARHSKEAAAGRARELLDPSPGLARASKAPGLPRLVKREKK